VEDCAAGCNLRGRCEFPPVSSGESRNMRERKSAAAPRTIVARLDTDETTARRLADIIVASLDAEGVAVSAYEAPTS
jgi:hypothetical protein